MKDIPPDVRDPALAEVETTVAVTDAMIDLRRRQRRIEDSGMKRTFWARWQTRGKQHQKP